MFNVAFKILVSAFPFFKEMIFGEKTKTEKMTGVALLLCFIIAILFMIIVNSFHYNLLLNKSNKELISEKVVLEETIKKLESNKLIKVCPDGKDLMGVLKEKLKESEEKLEECQNNSSKNVSDIKNTLNEME